MPIGACLVLAAAVLFSPARARGEEAVAFDPRVIASVQAATVLVVTQHGSGTGTIVDQPGGRTLIVTNHHVIAGPDGRAALPIWVVFASGSNDPFPAAVWLEADDPELDLALLSGPRVPGARALPLGAARPGMPVATAGFPHGFRLAGEAATPSPSFTVGEVKAARSSDEVPPSRMLVDVVVNPGNSGGPVVDERGRVVGIVVAHVPETARTLAIRSEAVKAFLGSASHGALVPEYRAAFPPAPVSRLPRMPDDRRLVEALPLLEVGATRGVAAVVAHESGRVILLASGRAAGQLRSAAASAVVTFRSRSGREQVRGATWLRSFSVSATLFSVEEPRGSRPPVLSITSAASLLPTTLLRVAVDAQAPFRAGHFARYQQGPAGDGFFQMDAGVGGLEAGWPILTRAGELVGFVDTSSRPTITLAIAADQLLREAGGFPLGGEVRLRETPAGTCRLEARIDLDDPLGTVRHAGLVVAPSGFRPEFPRVPREIGVVGPTMARAEPRGGRVELSAAVPCHERTYGQLWLEGDSVRWLSMPHGLSGPGGMPWHMVAGKEGWRTERGPASPWPPMPRAAAAADVPGCTPGTESLDPDEVYVVTRDPRCDGSVLTPAKGGAGRCIPFVGAPVGIARQGRLLYQSNFEAGLTYRLHAADRPSPRLEDRCRVPDAQRNDEIVAMDPCGHGDTLGQIVADAELGIAFQCRQNLTRLDGSRVGTFGGRPIRIGFAGRSLLEPPWGGLAVTDGSGRPVEVTGLPERMCTSCIIATAATREGFLVAVKGTGDVVELYAIDGAGAAVRRGAYPPDPSRGRSAQRPLLDGSGRLYRGAGNQFYRADPDAAAAVALPPGETLLSGVASAPLSPAPSPDGELYRTTPAARIYGVAPGAALPCAGQPGKFDPGRVYVLGGPDQPVADATDPTRVAFTSEILDAAQAEVTPDGRLLYLRAGTGTIHEFRPDAARLDRTRMVCRLVPGLAELDPEVPTACPEVIAFAVAPDTGELAVSCWNRESREAWISFAGRKVPRPEVERLHAGRDGLLLVGGSPSTTDRSPALQLLAPDGARIPVQGLPARMEVLSIRAGRDGFDAAISIDGSQGPPATELWHIARDGRAERAGTYRLEGGATSGALEADGTLVARRSAPDRATVRASTDGLPPVELPDAGKRFSARYVTGP